MTDRGELLLPGFTVASPDLSNCVQLYPASRPAAGPLVRPSEILEHLASTDSGLPITAGGCWARLR